MTFPWEKVQERTGHINLRKLPGTPAGCPWDTRRDKKGSTGRCPRNFLLFTIEELPFLPGHRPGVPGTPRRPGDFQKIYENFSYVPFLLPKPWHFESVLSHFTGVTFTGGQKSLLSHFWGCFNYLGVRGVLGGTGRYKPRPTLSCLSLKTLTSLDKESRPFFLCGSMSSSSPNTIIASENGNLGVRKLGSSRFLPLSFYSPSCFYCCGKSSLIVLGQEKRAQTQTVRSADLLVGWLSSTWSSGGQKVQYVHQSPGKTKVLAGYPGLLPGYPGGARKLEEKKSVFYFWPLYRAGCTRSENLDVFKGFSLFSQKDQGKEG